MIDWTINVGHLITIAVILLGAVGTFWRLVYDGRARDADAARSQNDIKEIKLDLKTLNEAVSNQKLIEHRIMRLEKWYDEIRHGRGFVQQRGIDGEYGAEGRR